MEMLPVLVGGARTRAEYVGDIGIGLAVRKR